MHQKWQKKAFFSFCAVFPLDLFSFPFHFMGTSKRKILKPLWNSYILRLCGRTGSLLEWIRRCSSSSSSSSSWTSCCHLPFSSFPEMLFAERYIIQQKFFQLEIIKFPLLGLHCVTLNCFWIKFNNWRNPYGSVTALPKQAQEEEEEEEKGWGTICPSSESKSPDAAPCMTISQDGLLDWLNGIRLLRGN